MSQNRPSNDLTLNVTAEPDGVKLWVGRRELLLHPLVAVRLAEELVMAACAITTPDTTYIEPERPSVH